jgi:hypothetical protein
MNLLAMRGVARSSTAVVKLECSPTRMKVRFLSPSVWLEACVVHGDEFDIVGADGQGCCCSATADTSSRSG